MGLFDKVKNVIAKKTQNTNHEEVSNHLNERTLKKENFYLSGVSYYTGNIGKLACSNPDWKLKSKEIVAEGKTMKKIFRYNYINKPVKLIPEPDNKNDKNAVLVMIAGEEVGYISRDENVHVLDILKNHEIKYISSFISGGQYKVVSENGDAVKLEDNIFINVRIGYV